MYEHRWLLCCSTCAGGLFDGKASAAERQRFLLEIIRTSSAQQAQQAAGRGAAQGAADSLSDSQVES